MLLFRGSFCSFVWCCSFLKPFPVVVLLGRIWGCGWNEHGNLGTGDQEDAYTLLPNQGVKSFTPPDMENPEIALAVGGAHYIVAAVEL